MAEGKKSYQLYTEWIEIFEALEDQEAGELIKHIFAYVNDKNPITKNPIVKIAFIQIKQQLKRDLIKWESKRIVNSANGAKGGRPKNPKEPKITERLISKPKKAVKVKVKVKDKEKKDIPTWEDFLKYALEKKPNVNKDSLRLKFSAWIENDWRNGNNKKIINWKSNLLNTLPHLKESELKYQKKIIR